RRHTRSKRDWSSDVCSSDLVAGDLEGGRRLIGILRPFVYRRYFDYGAFESMREMKELIDDQVERQESQADVKLGYGGIREIEFRSEERRVGRERRCGGAVAR